MKLQPVAFTLTVVNLLLLAFLLAQRPVEANTDSQILRGRGLQIVDDRGRPRATIQVLPAKPGEDETVILRLIDTNGKPGVKIANSVSHSGLSFVASTDKAHVILGADNTEGSLKLSSRDGREHVSKP
jgi:hypothetical protein